jgi:prolyl oligopeptidase
MRFCLRSLVFSLLFVACFRPPQAPVAAPAPSSSATAAASITAPATERRPVTETLHGVAVTDPYRWLEDQNSPETRDWITRQNAYTDSILGNAPGRAELASRIEALLNVESIGTPVVKGGRLFYVKRRAGEDVYSIYMRDGFQGSEELLIDAAPMSPKHTTNIGIEDVTTDGRLLAYYVREGGADETTVSFFDVDARKRTGEALPLARYQGLSLSPDHRTVYYTAFVKAGARVFSRALTGGEPKQLFGEGYGPEKILYSSLSEDGQWLLMHVLYGSAASKTEIYLKDVRNDGPVRTVVNDLDFRSNASFAGDQLVIQTNWNAPNDRVMAVGIADPVRANWREIVPENRNAAMQGVTPAGGRVFVRYLENVKPRIVRYGLDGSSQGEIAFDTLGRLGDVSGEWSSPTAFYSFSSFHVPTTVYSYDVASGRRAVFAQQQAPVHAEDFTVEQLWFPSKDGTRIPMFVMYRKGLERNGRNPAYVTGYGGFNSASLPSFSPRAITLAEHGGVYVLVNLRGGNEFGEAWHKAGMLANKQNVFDDFIGAAQYLIDQKFTAPEHLAIAGTSNGGLLVTAALTQRPDLYKAVVVGYPLVDMLRYHKFLVGSFWVPEYGSADDAAQFPPIYAYSPYQHVKSGTPYPAVLLITGDADTRVAPLHARKMTALLQHSTSSSNPVILRYHVSGGHSGGEPLSVQVANESEILAFVLNETK